MLSKIRFSLVALVLLLLVAGRPAAPIAAQGDSASEIIQRVNDLRASLGLPAFQVNGALTLAAQNHANWMAATGIYSHTGEGGSTPQTRAAAAGYAGYAIENIVGGMGLTPKQGVIWWQNSPVHYNTLVSSRYVDAGVGFAVGYGQNFYALVAGRPTNAGAVASASVAADPSAAPLMITPIELATPREDGSIVHVVQEGQALWSLAAYYDVELSYLYLINSLVPDDFLHSGDEIYIRLAEGQAPPPTPTPPSTHIVREGQTPWTIAAIYGISLGDLYLFNNLHEDPVLHPGNELIIHWPAGQPLPPTPTPPTTYIVQSGDSAWAIAARFRLAVDQLLAWNSLSATALLRPGDVLLIQPPTATPTPPLVATPASPGEAAAPTFKVIVTAQPPTPTSVSVAVAQVSLATTNPSPTPAATDSAPAQGAPLSLVAIGLAIVAGVGLLIVQRRGRGPS